MDWLQDSVPLRVKGVHIINQPLIFNIIFAMFKPFLRDKPRNRTFFHGADHSSLHKMVSSECLPFIYGGTLDIPTVNEDHWYQLLLSYDMEFQKNSSYGYKK